MRLTNFKAKKDIFRFEVKLGFSGLRSAEGNYYWSIRAIQFKMFVKQFTLCYKKVNL